MSAEDGWRVSANGIVGRLRIGAEGVTVPFSAGPRLVAWSTLHEVAATSSSSVRVAGEVGAVTLSFTGNRQQQEFLDRYGELAPSLSQVPLQRTPGRPGSPLASAAARPRDHVHAPALRFADFLFGLNLLLVVLGLLGALTFAAIEDDVVAGIVGVLVTALSYASLRGLEMVVRLLVSISVAVNDAGVRPGRG